MPIELSSLRILPKEMGQTTQHNVIKLICLLSFRRSYYDVDLDPTRTYKTKYWVVPKAENVRPYGILMRELPPSDTSDDY